ncbi:MAG: hypothetical protein P4L98_05665 [Ancalomicrobiaceae bacterium]|nr:hypothetical protein [Ancalomicrobiaceae bacterium]
MPSTDRTLVLNTPIDDLHGRGLVKELTLTTPRARLFRKFGSPQKVARTHDFENPTIVRIEAQDDDAVFAKFLSEMADIDSSQVDDLTAYDFAAAKSLIVDMINTAATGSDGNPTT